MKKPDSWKCLLRTRGLALRCLPLVVCFTVGLKAQEPQQSKAPASKNTVIHARTVLGVEGISNNASGDLSIRGDALVFKPGAGAEAHIAIASIQDVFLSQEDKQVGGVPMALTRTATPFEGGRVIGFFAHKKYDFVTLEYLDADGGFHGAIWQVNKGEGQILENQLEGKGVHVSALGNSVANSANLETNNDAK